MWISRVAQYPTVLGKMDQGNISSMLVYGIPPLLWVLRDHLDLTGTKNGYCQAGQIMSAVSLLKTTILRIPRYFR